MGAQGLACGLGVIYHNRNGLRGAKIGMYLGQQYVGFVGRWHAARPRLRVPLKIRCSYTNLMYGYAPG